jgi:hypothetical protein
MAQDETLRDQGMRVYLLLLLVFAPTLLWAQDNAELVQRIEQLEARMQRLEARLGMAPESATETTVQAQVSARYWISSGTDFEQQPPLREGLMTFPETISLQPAAYGYQSDGVFDPLKDVSRYPVIAAYLDGMIQVKKSARYTLQVKPTPPREVGGAGNVKLAVRIRLDDKQILNLPSSSRLSPRAKQVYLEAGNIPIHIEIVAQSPGFGPSPMGSKLFIGLQSDDAISPVAISQLLINRPGP